MFIYLYIFVYFLQNDFDFDDWNASSSSAPTEIRAIATTSQPPEGSSMTGSDDVTNVGVGSGEQATTDEKSTAVSQLHLFNLVCFIKLLSKMLNFYFSEKSPFFRKSYNFSFFGTFH